MSDTRHSGPATTPTASELFRSADKTRQKIIEAILREERQVMHQKHRTKIFDSIVGIIKEHVQ